MKSSRFEIHVFIETDLVDFENTLLALLRRLLDGDVVGELALLPGHDDGLVVGSDARLGTIRRRQEVQHVDHQVPVRRLGWEDGHQVGRQHLDVLDTLEKEKSGKNCNSGNLLPNPTSNPRTVGCGEENFQKRFEVPQKKYSTLGENGA